MKLINESIEEILQDIRFFYSPENLILNKKILKNKINYNLILIDKNSLINEKIDIFNYFLALYQIYDGFLINNLFDELNNYYIYFELLDNNLYGGIYDMSVGIKITRNTFISSECPLDAASSGYIYLPDSELMQAIKKIM